MKYENKVALITGSATNIGRATALAFAKEGASVIVHSRKNVSAGQKVAQEIEDAGGKAVFVRADLSDPTQVKELIKQAVDAFGTVDILVNNAGEAIGMPFLESTADYWLDQFNSNFFSAVLCSIEAAKIMKEKGQGVILNTASIRGLDATGRPGIMAYSAAKAAMISFTKTLAKELAPHITVNAVAPGFVLTPNYDATPEEVKKEFIDGTLIKRWLQPEEIAEGFVYLADQTGITGEVLVIDGGFSLKYQ